jgi:hypothetical protein
MDEGEKTSVRLICREKGLDSNISSDPNCSHSKTVVKDLCTNRILCLTGMPVDGHGRVERKTRMNPSVRLICREEGSIDPS